MPPLPKGTHGPVNLKALNKNVVQRLMSYLRAYRFPMLVVLVCIITASIASVVGMTFLETIIDDYIKPLLLEANPDFSGLLQVIFRMAAVFAVSVLAMLVQGLLMARISQGVQKTIRDQMFSHMQTLPIRYFNIHTFGDVMSHYTNDVDTLQQMLSQSIPQTLSSLVTIVTIFITMLIKSPLLTAFVILSIFAMLQATKKIGGNSAKFFTAQQKSLGSLNGYIEEMISGQKVVKVFCHEEKIKEEFDRRNQEL